jgi:nucleoside-diphosphate-sugar epimerase
MSSHTVGDGNAYCGRAVLVTGGAGFIGSHLARRLAALGAEVRVLDDLSTGQRANLPSEGVRFIEASVLDDDPLREAVRGCDCIFHEAAMVSVPLSVEQPEQCAAINITGTERVLEAARDAEVRRVVFASSAAVYGAEPNLPSTERDPIDCRSPYAASKAAGEGLVSAFSHCYDLSTVSLRYFNIFGPRQDPNSPYAAAIAAFMDALLAHRTPRIFGDGTQSRDFTHIDNVVHANLLAGASERDLRGEVINIGTGQRINLLEVLQQMGRALGREVSFEFGPERAGDVPHSCADITRARELLGYEPIVSFADGIERTLSAAGG